MQTFKHSIASLFHRLGLSANFLTALGLFFAGLSGCLIYVGLFFWAAVALLVSGVLDLMDGEVARISGSAKNSFGGIFDSLLDRYGDAAIVFGILFFFAARGNYLFALLSAWTLVGFFAVSYVRARAECEIKKCRVGFWERGERIVYIVLALFLNNLPIALLVLAVGTHWTAALRLVDAAQGGKWSLSGSRRGRTHWSYWAICSTLILLLILVKIDA